MHEVVKQMNISRNDHRSKRAFEAQMTSTSPRSIRAPVRAQRSVDKARRQARMSRCNATIGTRVGDSPSAFLREPRNLLSASSELHRPRIVFAQLRSPIRPDYTHLGLASSYAEVDRCQNKDSASCAAFNQLTGFLLAAKIVYAR